MKAYATEVAPFVNPAKHAFCAAPYDEGNGIEWYRGRIEELVKNQKMELKMHASCSLIMETLQMYQSQN